MWQLMHHVSTNAVSGMTQYKLKSKLNRNVSLLCYPVLQAADIILYKYDCLFNNKKSGTSTGWQGSESAYRINEEDFETIKSLFVRDHQYVLERCFHFDSCDIRGLLDPDAKMSKSSGRVNSVIFLDDPDFLIKEKIKQATTTTIGIDNLIRILTLLDKDAKEDSTCKHSFENRCEELKGILGEVLCERITDIQRNSTSLSKDDCMQILVQCEVYARQVALENYENLLSQMTGIEPL